MILQRIAMAGLRGACFAALLLSIEEITNLLMGQAALSLLEVATVLTYYCAAMAVVGVLTLALKDELDHILGLLAASGGFIAAGKVAEELWWRDIAQWEAVVIGYPLAFLVTGLAAWGVARTLASRPDLKLGLLATGILFLPSFRAMNINAFGSFTDPAAIKADVILLVISMAFGLLVWKQSRRVLGRLTPSVLVTAVLIGLLTVVGRTIAAEPLPGPSSETGKPDILLVVIDTLRADHLGAYGHTVATSPNLDALAAEGLRYEQAGSPAGWTLPSFGAFVTGKYPSGHGAGLNNGEKNTQSALDAGVPTLAEALSSAGYRTGAIVTNPYLKRSFGLSRGFDTYSDALGLAHMPMFVQPLRMLNIPVMGGRYFYRPADIMVDEALEWWTATAGGSRFLMLHLMDPHDPYNPPSDHAEVIGSPHEMDVLNLYDQEIHFTDHELGRLLDQVGPQTMVFVTSDHGDEFGEHDGAYPGDHRPTTRHGHTLYQELLHVPLMIRGPGLEPRVIREPVRSFDVVPTIVALAGASPLESDGEVLAAVVGSGTQAEKSVGAQAIRYGSEKRAVRIGKHKLIETRWGMELYDLSTDPTEQENIAQQESQLIPELRDQLPPERDASEANTIDEETRRQLESLGYMQ